MLQHYNNETIDLMVDQYLKAEWKLLKARKRLKAMSILVINDFEKCGVTTFKNDKFQLTYTKGEEYETIDEEALKRERPDVWEKCLVERTQGPTLTISYGSTQHVIADGSEEE